MTPNPHQEAGAALPIVTSALADARNTLAKTATGRLGSDELTIPRAAFDSVLRNIDKARAFLAKLEGDA